MIGINFLKCFVVAAALSVPLVGDSWVEDDRFGRFIGAMPELGYLVVQDLAPRQVDPWESTTFGTLTERQAKVKGAAPVGWGDELYYRFTFAEQSYGSEDAAHARWLLWRERPENLSGYREKVFPLRRGFAIGNKVYIVSTDVARFADALARMADTRGEYLLAQPDQRQNVVTDVRQQTNKELTRKLMQERLADLGY